MLCTCMCSYFDNENVGCEIINLFKDDKGRYYIYVLSYGSIAKKHNNRIK